MNSTIAASTQSVRDAVAALQAGRPVLVLDDEGRENEGDLVVAAERIDAATVNLMISRGRGLVCVAAASSLIDRLELAQMVDANSDRHGTAFTVSVDAATTGTGIAASDRATTIRALADPTTRPGDLRRPGHVFPLRAVAGGVLERRGHTEAAVELATLAGLVPAAAICEVLDDEGNAASHDYLRDLAEELGIPLLHVTDVAHVATQHPSQTGTDAVAALPTRHGNWHAVAHRAPDGAEHLALVLGHPATTRTPLVRVHSECLTGDVLGSYRCDCGEQLEASMAAIAAAGSGVVIYLRGHEGRGIGLVDKIRAYALQERGCDTVEANTRLGLPVDAREYRAATTLLRQLGLHQVRLMTNNPAKVKALRAAGIAVLDVVPLQLPARPENQDYLDAKRRRLGHDLQPLTAGLHVVPRTTVPSSPTEGSHAC